MKKIIVVSLCILCLISSFVLTVSADSTFVSNCSYYSPIFSVGGIGNTSFDDFISDKFSYGSIITPSTNVMLPKYMEEDITSELYLNNTSSWAGTSTTKPNFNDHGATYTTRFYNELDVNSNIAIRAETTLNGFGGNTQIFGYIYDIAPKESYFISQAGVYGFNVLDGFAIYSTSESYLNEGTLDLKWNQYEINSTSNLIELVPVYVTISFEDYPTYSETVDGVTYFKKLIPFIDYYNLDTKELLDRQLISTVDGERQYYFNNLSFSLNQSNTSILRLYNTYDSTETLTSAAGGYLKTVTNMNNVISFDDISFTDWLVNGVGAFMNFEILPGFSLSVIFVSILGVIIVKAFLNAMAGG